MTWDLLMLMHFLHLVISDGEGYYEIIANPSKDHLIFMVPKPAVYTVFFCIQDPRCTSPVDFAVKVRLVHRPKTQDEKTYDNLSRKDKGSGG